LALRRLPPADLHALRRVIASGAVALEPKAKGVVRFALAHPVDIALGTANGLAQACNVSPSVVTRLVKAFGFARFADFRELFKQSVRSGCVGLETAFGRDGGLGAPPRHRLPAAGRAGGLDDRGAASSNDCLRIRIK